MAAKVKSGRMFVQFSARDIIGYVGALIQNSDKCPFHLPGQNIFCTGQNVFCPGQNIFCPGQNIFCPGQNQICPSQNNFVNDKIFFVHDKNLVHSLKIIFALRKLV